MSKDRENFTKIFNKIKNLINESHENNIKNCCGCSYSCDGNCGCNCSCHNYQDQTDNQYNNNVNDQPSSIQTDNNFNNTENEKLIVKIGNDENNINYDFCKNTNLLTSEIKNTFNSINFENWKEAYNSFINYLINQGFDKKTSDFILYKTLYNFYVKNDEYLKNLDNFENKFKINRFNKEEYEKTIENKSCEDKEIYEIMSLAGLKEYTIKHTLSNKKKMETNKKLNSKEVKNKNDDSKLPSISDLKGKKPERNKKERFLYFAGKFGDNPFAK